MEIIKHLPSYQHMKCSHKFVIAVMYNMLISPHTKPLRISH